MTEYTSSDLVKLLQEAGFAEIRINGDHHIFRNASIGKTIAVPYTHRKQPIRIGTAKAIIREIQKSKEAK